LKAIDNVAQQRLSLFQLAEILGNIPEVCQERGIYRIMCYEYKRRFQTHGFQGKRLIYLMKL